VLVLATSTRPTSIEQLISSELCARLDRIDILSRKVFAGKLQGERRSKRRGQSVEFEDYRNYVPGDDLRHVDWNIFARLEKFFIKIFQEEEDLSFHVVLDATASMEAGTPPPSKLISAMRLAMALGYIALVNNDRLSVSVFNGTALRRLGPVRGRRNVQRLAAFLLTETRPGVSAPVVAGDGEEGETTSVPAGDFTAALRTIARARTGKGVMLVLSDFLIQGGYEEGLRYLGGGGGGRGESYDTYCLQVLSPGEIDPTLERMGSTGQNELVGDLRLIDAETNRSSEVTITADMIKKYKQAVVGYMDELKAFCGARGMTYGLVRSDTVLETLLLDYLRKRGLVR